MKLVFGLVGAAIGASLGEFAGLLAGTLLGVMAGFVWDAVRTPGGTKPAGESTAFEVLARRVNALEKEVGFLREQVRSLSADGATARAAPPPIQPVPPMPAPPAAAPRPAPAVPAAAPAAARIAVPAPPRVPEIVDEPKPELVVEPTAPMALAIEPEAPAAPVAPVPIAAPAAATPPARTVPADAPAWTAPAPAATAARRVVSPPPPPAPPLRDRLPPFVARWIFGGNTIVKIGVLLLFLGLAFLLAYTAERVTVPVEFRYAGVALVGVVLLGLGWRLRARPEAAGGSAYGVILQGAGIGVFYLTALGALRLNPLLTPTLAFAFMAGVAALGAILAVLQDAPWLAYVSIAEGFAAPVLVSTGSGAYVPLFSYLAILDAGILAIAWFKAWRPLNLVGAVATFTLALAWAQTHYVDADYAGVQAFLLFFFLLFTVTGVLFARRALAAGEAASDERPLAERAADALRRVGRVDSTLTFGVPLAAFTLQYLLVRDSHWGPAWAALGFALFHLVLSFGLLRGASGRYALLGEAHAIVGTIFATLAVPLALEGVWTGATWAIEAAGMYWLGARQRRVYARAFALLVMAAAASRLLDGLSLDERPGTPLLAGSTLGMAMLAAALAAMDFVRRRIVPEERSACESIGALVLPFAASLALAALPWMLWPAIWAAAASAWIAFGCAALCDRLEAPVLRASSVLLHLLALTGLTLRLHPLAPTGMAVDGWPALVATVLIGAALLASGWLGLRESWRAATADETPDWPLASSVGLVAGIAVIASSLLSVMAIDRAALAWPWLGVFAMWLGVRLRHPALALSALLLQLAAGGALVAFGPAIWVQANAAKLGDSALVGMLVLTIAGFVTGELARGAAARARASAWWHSTALQWLLVAWSAGSWSQALPPVVWRELLAHGQAQAMTAWLACWITLTSAAMLVVARWRDWRVLGQATLATLPLWIVLALDSPIGTGSVAPSAAFGWFAWPLALAWHLGLLRWQGRFRPASLEAPQHIVGFWFFVGLATLECTRRLQAVGVAPGSAWATLGVMLVPALVLALVTRPAVLRRWPFAAHREATLTVGCGPLALGLFAWLWVANATAGDAAPLSYLPVVNPLEVGLGLALLAIALWLRALPEAARAGVPRPIAFAIGGATAFAIVTGAVLRACHHLVGVAWDAEALFGSTLAQAALSVTWSLIGVALMLAGHRSARRAAWVVGAALLGVVVAKLFLVELADRGSLYRIVSFIVVGVLMLVVGYFAPMPPKRADDDAAEAA